VILKVIVLLWVLAFWVFIAVWQGRRQLALYRKGQSSELVVPIGVGMILIFAFGLYEVCAELWQTISR
jgi:hypothetical protein